jgi:hypothetical protein
MFDINPFGQESLQVFVNLFRYFLKEPSFIQVVH